MTATLIRPYALYRFFDADDNLLYVGISGRPNHRWRDHQKKPWWPLVARNTVEWIDGLDAARDAESAAIRTELPIHNERGKPKPPKPPKPKPPRPPRPPKDPGLRPGDRHRNPAVTFRPDPAIKASAQGALKARGRDFGAFLAACLAAVHSDPDGFLERIEGHWPPEAPIGRPKRRTPSE